MDCNNILAFCTYNSISTLVCLTKGFKFGTLISILKKKWPYLSDKCLRITYSISGYQTILLENDLDIELMITHGISIGAEKIDILVMENTTGSEIVLPKPTNCNVSELGGSTNNTGCGLNNIVTSTSTQASELFSERWSSALREVGQVFIGGPPEFRIALAKYAIEKGFNYIFKKNDGDRVTAICSEVYCPWKVHARFDGVKGDFMIKKWETKHECNGGIRKVSHRRLDSKLVASLFEKQLRDKPTLRPIEIKQNLKSMYGVDVRYWNAWKGKEKALVDVQGEESLAYDRLRAYEKALLRTNPGSYTSLEYNHESGNFERFFLAFDACIEGFKHCRPIIFLDGTFMKGKYKGIVLTATGKNGDQGLYPLCFGVVDVENEKNWVWFVKKMAEIVDKERKLVFISDRNKGLLEAVSTVFPNSPHGFCLEHLKQNLRKKISIHKGNKKRELLVSMFTRVVHARTQGEFIEQMTLFHSTGGSCVEKFIDELPVIHWANAFFPGCRYGELTSNAAESFNSWILNERTLPVDVMLDQIRQRLMEQMAERLEAAKNWRTRLCPKMETRLQELMRLVCNWKVIRSTEFIFEVHSTPTRVVDLKFHSCGCREWDVEGFPCPHALAAIQYKEDDVYDYCERYYTKLGFIDSYTKPIYPVIIDDDNVESDSDFNIVIKAPKMKRPAGRPKRKRGEASINQQKKTILCTRCGKVGNHNRRTCKEPIN